MPWPAGEAVGEGLDVGLAVVVGVEVVVGVDVGVGLVVVAHPVIASKIAITNTDIRPFTDLFEVLMPAPPLVAS